MMALRFYLVMFTCAAVVFYSKRLLRHLRYLQQDGYDSGRYLRWVWRHRAFDRRGTLTVIATALAYLLFPKLALVLGSAVLVAWYLVEKDPRKHGKLTLHMTDRARRIYTAAFALYLIFQGGVAFTFPPVFWIGKIMLFQLVPAFLAASVFFLSFSEKKRQRVLVEEAKGKLADISPYIIGITGSYGKTSTKDALGNILQITLGTTFWPEKGVNTEMGITREIRGKLMKGTKYGVFEMGAYGPGSIRRLCSLAPPQAGIITTIGVAHLDRFKDQETILAAKSELAQAIPQEGILVCNGDNEGARRIAGKYPKKTTLLYGFDNTGSDLDCWIEEITLMSTGSAFSVRWKGQNYQGATALFGKAAVSNLAGVFAMACALGAQPEFVLGAIANLRPVENRLQVHCEKGITYLRDAYNSNPEGFRSALEVLSFYRPRRKILMTPGMIELGYLDRELHERIGKEAAAVCDIAIIVGKKNLESLTQGLALGGMSKENILFAEDRTGAFQELESILTPGDVVLIENDLPDLYETRERF